MLEIPARARDQATARPANKVSLVTFDTAGLQGRRVLIVEDETLVSMLIEDILMDFGCVVVGPAAKLDHAVKLAESEDIDLAILDVNLGGTRSFPVADVLAKQGVPFVFASGYSDLDLPPPHQDRLVVQKPFNQDKIAEVLMALLKG